MALFKTKAAPAPVDLGLQQIAEWEQWLLGANRQQMIDDGLDAATIDREFPAKRALVVAAAEQMRRDYLSWKNRGLPCP